MFSNNKYTDISGGCGFFKLKTYFLVYLLHPLSLITGSIGFHVKFGECLACACLKFHMKSFINCNCFIREKSNNIFYLENLVTLIHVCVMRAFYR